MKKILIVFAAGALLTACDSALDQTAADEFCECMTQGDESASESTGFMEILESTEQRKTCLTKWQSKYNGKITDGFRDILKESCPDGYKQAEGMGMLD